MVTPPHASAELVLAFVCLALLPPVLLLAGVWRARRERGVLSGLAAVVAWGLLAQALAASGVLGRFDLRPPPAAGLLLAAFLVSGAVVLGPLGRALDRLPLGALVLAQAFRLPLELAMDKAASEGVMPPQMSLHGLNLDVLTGLTALVVGPLALAGRAPRWLLLGWNLAGTALLVNILVVAVASLPVFAAFGPDRVNTFVAFPPFVALPTLLVPTAIVGHALLWRRLLRG